MLLTCAWRVSWLLLTSGIVLGPVLSDEMDACLEYLRAHRLRIERGSSRVEGSGRGERGDGEEVKDEGRIVRAGSLRVHH
eukprot:1162977-Rhodomonas_salina.3